jgi:hypothetical protein
MKNWISVACLSAALSASEIILAQSATFSYQGRLSTDGEAASGSYDFEFSLRDAASSGGTIGATLAMSSVPVSVGLFMVALDFGDSAFDGSQRWLEIGVRTNSSAGPYTALTPLQPITAAPSAVFASRAASAGAATALVDGGATLTNINGAGIQTGTVSSSQIDSATDAAYRMQADAVTNRYSLPLILGSSRGAHFMCGSCGDPSTPAQSYSNLLVGVDQVLPNLTGSSILFPDRGGIFWATGAGIYDWNDHSGEGGRAHNELQILGQNKMAFACYNAATCDGGFQMGGSGPIHDKFWFQYDTAPSIPGLGFSKLIQFVTRSGPDNAYAYSAIRAVAADTSGDRNTLNFYSGTPSAIDNSGGNRMGTMLTDGWDLRGRIVTEHATYSGGDTNAIDWLKPSSSEFRIQGDSAAFVTANLPAGTTNNESRVVFIKSGAFAPALFFPADWHWLNEAGDAVAPSAMVPGRILKLTLTALGPGDANVLAEAKLGVYP